MDEATKYLELQAENSRLADKNAKLSEALREIREQVVALKQEIEKLSQPPNGFAAFVQTNDDGSVDITMGGRKLRVNVTGDVDIESLRVGQEVLLNEAMNIVAVREFEVTGEVVTLKEILDADRASVVSRADEVRVALIAHPLSLERLKPGDKLRMDPRTGYLYEKLPKADVEGLLLEDVPDISYENIGGLGAQIEAIRDAVELPFLHRELFIEHELKPPKGVLLYGPPGCGKTLIAKAVANSLAKRIAAKDPTATKTTAKFISIKGPELLNKYVGETERQIRDIFQRAREASDEGFPVIIFFDEMESLFRTRGTGKSSDVENTIVPQLLAEIDGVEQLSNVIVIGASNREDMIDPAILRPGRLDVKIKVERPNADAALEILKIYLTTTLPYDQKELEQNGGDLAPHIARLCEETIERMYSTDDSNKFLEVTYATGKPEILYFKDFNSGAMIENIVARAKKYAIKRYLAGGAKGIRLEDLLAAIRDEFKENEDLPNTTNPDDWARISGKRGERITYVRTLVHDENGKGRTIENIQPGQYL